MKCLEDLEKNWTEIGRLGSEKSDPVGARGARRKVVGVFV